MSAVGAVDRKYSYVSYSRPDVTTSIEALIEAARTWRPLAGRVIRSFDFRGFLEHHTRELQRSRKASSRPMVDQVLDVLLRPEHCKSPEDHVRGQSAVTDKIERAIEADRPIRVVVPSFPGRPCNPLTHTRVQPDLSEAYAFVRLHRISLVAQAVHAPGMHFVILLDGKAYNPFYGYTPEAEHQYPRDLQRLVDALGIRESVSFVDLQDLVDERTEEFDAMRAEVLPEVEEHWDEPDDGFRDELIESMRLGTNTVAINAAAVQLLKWTDVPDAPELHGAMRDAVEERARATAFAYMVFLVTIRRMNLIDTVFPDAVRGTVHPKIGQYSPRLTSSTTTIAPWHGVAVVHPDGQVDTVYESKLYQEHGRYRGVYLDGEYTPFFHEELTPD